MGQSVLTEPIRRDAGMLAVEGVPVSSIAAAVGTPVYVYSSTAVRTQYELLDAALAGVPHRIHYSVKANGNLALLRLLRRLGAGVDIVSGGELYRARLAGFGGDDVVFSGVGKTSAEIRQALLAGVRLINAESELEVAAIDEEAGRLGMRAPVALRINPEVEVSSPHHYIRTGERGSKFGIPYDDAYRIARTTNGLPHVSLRGLDMHIGSQVAGMAPYAEAVQRLMALYEHAVASGVTELRFLDVGGGLAVQYEEETPFDVEALARLLVDTVQPTGLTLLLEPGRFLVANAGILLTRVLYRKSSGGKTYVITDAGMNDLLRPSHYHAFHHIEPASTERSMERGLVDVVGPVCESGDFLALDRELPEVNPGDLLVVHSAGAYGYAMSSNYNARPRPAEVVVEGRQFAVVTARETYQDLVRQEQSTLVWREG